MGLGFGWVHIDAHDPKMLAHFWSKVLDFEIEHQGEEDGYVEVDIGPNDGKGPHLSFGTIHDEKKVKNRLHFDLVPDDQAAEVERVLALGATKVDIGQGEVSWVVMADPEGNEFCILRARTPGEDD